jgi:hypothetical protein
MVSKTGRLQIAASLRLQTILGKFGFRISRRLGELNGAEPELLAVISKVKPYTMTSAERIAAMWDATRYVSKNSIPGAIVECGVWRGGSMMTAAFALLGEGDVNRDLFLFDTFEGMPPPSSHDIDRFGRSAQLWQSAVEHQTSEPWCYASVEDVRKNLQATQYPSDRVHFIPGLVEETVPGNAPDEIALLRLDTDLYESTAHELKSLVPSISRNGVLIIDDYGHWQGSKKAVDEFKETWPKPLLFTRIDYSGRIAVMP